MILSGRMCNHLEKDLVSCKKRKKNLLGIGQTLIFGSYFFSSPPKQASPGTLTNLNIKEK